MKVRVLDIKMPSINYIITIALQISKHNEAMITVVIIRDKYTGWSLPQRWPSW